MLSFEIYYLVRFFLMGLGYKALQSKRKTPSKQNQNNIFKRKMNEQDNSVKLDLAS